jgi:hypothetical protein
MSRPLRIQYPNAWYHIDKGTEYQEEVNKKVHSVFWKNFTLILKSGFFKMVDAPLFKQQVTT